MPHIFQNDRTEKAQIRNARLDDKPNGWMLVSPLKMFRNTDTITHLARCNACNVDIAQTAGHGDSLRMAFEASREHNTQTHPK